MPSQLAPTAFTLYRWSNPSTTAVYPFLSLATDRSALLSFRDHDIGLRLTAETAHWLAHDFEATDQGLLDISTVRYLLDTTFAGGPSSVYSPSMSSLGPAGASCRCTSKPRPMKDPSTSSSAWASTSV